MLEAAQSGINQLYKQEFVNYTGKTKDKGESCSEVIAELLLQDLKCLKRISTITRKASYRTKSHVGFIDVAHAQREEDRIAKKIFSQRGLPLLGVVLDYQTPLKDKRSDDAGKIDLLAYDGSVLRILELKRPKSRETMLRCVLEGYTYYKIVNVEKLLSDFGLPAKTKVLVSPLVFHNGFQHREMKQERPQLKALMEELHIEPFYYDKVRKAKDFFVVTK
jgi:hypothetical protein